MPAGHVTMRAASEYSSVRSFDESSGTDIVYCMSGEGGFNLQATSRFLLALLSLLIVTALFIHCSATDEGMTTAVGPLDTHAGSSSSHEAQGMCGVALVAIGMIGVAIAMSVEYRGRDRDQAPAWLLLVKTPSAPPGRLRLFRLCVMRL